MKDTTTKKQGFSLIEIIIALLVVAVGITAMIGLLGSSLGSSSKSRDDIHVVSFADMILNYFHAQTEWKNIPTEGTVSLPDYYGSTTELRQGSIAQFTLAEPTNDETSLWEAFTVTYKLQITQEEDTPKVKHIHLLVWPGYSTNSPPRRFYTEVYNWADQ